jgi:hypothetical protein
MRRRFMRVGIVAFGAVGILLLAHPAAACNRPDTPACATQSGPFASDKAADDCRKVMLRFRAGMDAHAACLGRTSPRDAQAARADYDDIRVRFNRRARGSEAIGYRGVKSADKTKGVADGASLPYPRYYLPDRLDLQRFRISRDDQHRAEKQRHAPNESVARSIGHVIPQQFLSLTGEFQAGQRGTVVLGSRRAPQMKKGATHVTKGQNRPVPQAHKRTYCEQRTNSVHCCFRSIPAGRAKPIQAPSLSGGRI